LFPNATEPAGQTVARAGLKMNDLGSLIRLHKVVLLSLAFAGSAAEITNLVTALVTVCIGLVLFASLLEEAIVKELSHIKTVLKNEGNND
jgi:hypothetical protein